jgi:CRISPR-associated protein Cas1
MYELRFKEKSPANRSIEQLRGIEGVRVKRVYENMAKKFGLKWSGRKYDVEDWDSGDVLNKCLSSATAALYGVTESAVLAAGYAPSIGFIHVGKPLSFVYDIADIVKFDTVIPVAFSVAAKNPPDAESVVRRECRDAFRRTKLLQNIIPMIEEVLGAGGKEIPDENGVVGPAFSDGAKIGDDGHRG